MSLAPHPFSLRQLQYAIAVADSLNFRLAAEACRVSQPALSAQLAQLETVLGVQLFERDRRRVLMTAAGAAIVGRARSTLREADDLVALAKLSGDPLAGTLHVGVIPTISPYLLPAIKAAFRSAYPTLTVMWVEDKTETLVRMLHDGKLDAVLLALEAEIGDLDREVLGTDPFVLATATEHPLAMRSSPVKPAELRDTSVLLLSEGHCFREQTLAYCASRKVRELEFRATSLSTLAQMVASGAGVTLLPQLAVATETKRAKLRIRPFTTPAPKRTIALAWRRRSPIADALRRLAITARSAYPEPAARRKSSIR